MRRKSSLSKPQRGGVRAYARHRGCSATAVEKALQSRRISRDSRGKIDFKKADQDWERNTQAGAPYSTPPPRKAPAEPEMPGEAEALARSTQYVRARAVREFFQANLARVEYEERIGRLIAKDEVQAAAFNRFREFRERMLGIPSRVAALLVAESGLSNARCHEILDAEIRRALNDFADQSGAERPDRTSVTRNL